MARLPKYTLNHNEKKDRWDLTNDASDKTVKSFENKADALEVGTLEKAVSSDLSPENSSKIE